MHIVRRSYVILLVTIISLCLCTIIISSCGKSGAKNDNTPSGDYKAGELIVKFKKGTSSEDITKIISESGGLEIISGISPTAEGETDMYLIQLDKDVSVEEAAKNFESREEVEYAEPNYKRSIN